MRQLGQVKAPAPGIGHPAERTPKSHLCEPGPGQGPSSGRGCRTDLLGVRWLRAVAVFGCQGGKGGAGQALPRLAVRAVVQGWQGQQLPEPVRTITVLRVQEIPTAASVGLEPLALSHPNLLQKPPSPAVNSPSASAPSVLAHFRPFPTPRSAVPRTQPSRALPCSHPLLAGSSAATSIT